MVICLSQFNSTPLNVNFLQDLNSSSEFDEDLEDRLSKYNIQDFTRGEAFYSRNQYSN